MQGTLIPAAWDTLRANLPDMSQFQRMVGVKRGYGQAPHNRGCCTIGTGWLSRSLGESS